MRYTTEQLFAFMEENRPIRAISIRGNVYHGFCWAFSEVQNEEEDGVPEPSLEIGPIGKGPHVVLYASEIEKIEFLD